MDTKLQILTSGENVFYPLYAGGSRPTKPCVVYSIGGVASISPPLVQFHLAYLPLDEISARPADTAPCNTKLLLRPRDGLWTIGSIREDTRRHYVQWAPLPKLPAELKTVRG